jgi:hypothetical protein
MTKAERTLIDAALVNEERHEGGLCPRGAGCAKCDVIRAARAVKRERKGGKR